MKEHVMVTMEENNPSTPFKALMPNLMLQP
jgi:hypothetical protein